MHLFKNTVCDYVGYVKPEPVIKDRVGNPCLTGEYKYGVSGAFRI